MRYVLVSAAAAMALVGAATIGNAQAPDDKGKGPAAEGKGSAQEKAPQREPGAAKQAPQAAPGRSEPRAEGRTEPKSEPRKGAQRDMDKDQPKATERQSKDQDRPKSTEQPGKDRPKATEQKPKDQPRTTDIPKSSKEPGKDQKATEQRPKDQPQDKSKSTEAPQQGKDKDTSKSATQRQGERVQVSEQQRTSVRERLTKERRVEKTRINVSVNIGTTIPRSVRLHTLPVAIVSLAPAYRGYSYILLEDDTICIIEPRTYVIVDVIPAGTQRADRPGRTQLALSADQMRFIFTSVPKERRADVRVRLALGAEVPRDVELLTFPGVVTERVPEIQRYRYIVSGDDIVVVDPSDNGVVLVIND